MSNVASTLFRKVPNTFQYVRDDGRSISREFDTRLPDGTRTSGQWIYRDANREYLDKDEYLSNLLQRNNLNIDAN